MMSSGWTILQSTRNNTFGEIRALLGKAFARRASAHDGYGPKHEYVVGRYVRDSHT